MSLQIKLYGDLKEKVQQQCLYVGAPITLNIDTVGIETVSDILKKLFIENTEISHIFVNGKYSDVRRIVKDGDRIGLFPRRMGLIFVEIVVDKYISVKTKISADLKEQGAYESIIEVPEGSTIKTLLEKYKFSTVKDKLIIMVNGKACYESVHILKDGDDITILPSNSGANQS